MASSQVHISESTPMGASLVADGATFRVWAPAAEHAYVLLDGADEPQPSGEHELIKDPASGHWTGFLPGVVDGTSYRFFVVGPGGSGLKRDPRARELESRDRDGTPSSVTRARIRGTTRISSRRRRRI